MPRAPILSTHPHALAHPRPCRRLKRLASGKVRVPQRLIGTDALRRVKLEQLLQKVDGCMIEHE